MFQHLVVPVDGSPAAWAAVPIAARMAAAVDGTVEVVTVVDRLAELVPTEQALTRGIADLAGLEVTPRVTVLADDSVEAAITRYVESTPGSMLLMSSHGHGRSAAVLGSTADALLRALFGPIVVIGPHVRAGAGRLGGTYVVPVDGSDASEQIVPIAGAWAIEFDAVPWLVEVLAPAPVTVPDRSDVFESALPARLAEQLRRRTHRPVEFEVLHGEHVARALVDFAGERGASLIFATTHGRTGLDRLRLGSVTAEVVRHAACPVVLLRPPVLR